MAKHKKQVAKAEGSNAARLRVIVETVGAVDNALNDVAGQAVEYDHAPGIAKSLGIPVVAVELMICAAPLEALEEWRTWSDRDLLTNVLRELEA